MSDTNQSRTDVAAVGSIAFTSPSLTGGDTFAIAGTVSGDGYYYLLVYDTVNRYYVWARGGLGSLLSGMALPQNYVIHYFKVSSNFNVPWPTNVNNMYFVPYNDPGGNDQTGLTNTVMAAVTDNAGAVRLSLQTYSTGSVGVKLNSYDPIGIFSTGNLQVGYHYIFTNAQNTVPNIPVFLEQGLLDGSTTYGGLPYGIGPLAPVATQVQAVIFPLNWWPSNGGLCNAQVTSGPDTANLAYNICDRYRVMVGTTSSFYTNNCTNMTVIRGNTQLTDCAATGGYMYYLPDVDPAQGCGKGWNYTDTYFVDMTDTGITAVANPYGGCYDQTQFCVCTYDTTGKASCTVAARSSDTCKQIRTDPCPNCSNCTKNCSAGQDCSTDQYCPNCKPTCDPSICTPTHNVTWWAWLIIIILAVILLFLLLTVLHKSTKSNLDTNDSKYSEKDHAEPAKKVSEKYI